MVITEILNNRLCIGCGFCAGVCPQSCINMTWDKSATWLPVIDMDQCDGCGLCLKVCPNSIDSLKVAGTKSIKSGEMNGLNDKKDNSFFISYNNSNNRAHSASGGTTTKLLQYLLECGYVDFVVTARPRMAKIGEPHFETVICRTPEEVRGSRSSAYGPLHYDIILKKIEKIKKPCAITVLPCIQRAINNLPRKWRKHIKYTIGITCSHNVTDQLCDYMAHRHGISNNKKFLINYRDKQDIPDANQFNTYFQLEGGNEIRTPRMKNGFTPAWRNYWFAQECCLYCPDFYNTASGISVKDAWGKMSIDPRGTSLCIVRNKKIDMSLHELKLKNDIYLEECDVETIKESQNATARYKQVDFLYRWLQHPALQEAVKNLPHKSIKNKSAVKDYYKKLITMHITKYIFRGSTFPRYLLLIFITRILGLLLKVNNLLNKFRKILIELIASSKSYYSQLTKWGIPSKPHDNRSIHILITGGYGYQNVGDEAQLGANISRWEKLIPECNIRVFSPNPEYTAQHHKVKSIQAPRNIWFHADRNEDYATSNKRFQRRFFIIKLRMIISAYLMRIGLPAIFCKPSEYAILNEIIRADILHVSGGGFLTGMTRSRLWENCLLMYLCHLLGAPVILTGQTIGLFKNKTDHKLAKWGLEHAKFIYLRDNGLSEAEVKALGIQGDHIQSTFDDALFCKNASREKIDDVLKINGINPEHSFITVHYHYWGQNSEVKLMSTMRFAESCDYIAELTNTQILFIPMTPSDELPEQSVINTMAKKATLLKYNYDYKIARGVIGQSKLIFTMKHHPIIFAYGEGVPVISVALDDYYYHKNKGAMDIWGQKDFLLDKSAFLKGHQIFRIIEKAWHQKNDIAFNLKKSTSEAQKREYEVFELFWQKTHLRIVD